MNQNDMWIAATAHAIEAVLVSTDRDFEHLHDAWIDFVYVDQQDFQATVFSVPSPTRRPSCPRRPVDRTLPP